MSFPTRGRPAGELLEELGELRRGDLDWRRGRAFSLVYFHDDAGLEELQAAVGSMFLHENALNPFRYATLRRMEQELVAMGCDLFGAVRGAVTSGGTESIFLACQSARDEARDRGVADPTLVAADTAHPAFAKAAHYLDLELVRVPAGTDGRAVPERVEAAIDERTALVVASAPCYPYGVIDPVPEIAAAARRAGCRCHVDACLGGWLLPWWERLGEQVPPWDFRVEGVTSLSADLHKYGYAYKGASLVLYGDEQLYRRQVFTYEDWPGGFYASATTAGTRPGAPIAGAWATVTHLGAEGYLRQARRVLEATRGFRAGIESIAPLRVTSDPDLSVFEFGSEALDMEAVGDGMDDRGWHLDRQPGGLHLMLAPGHDRVVEEFCTDLAAVVADPGRRRGTRPAYGGVVD